MQIIVHVKGFYEWVDVPEDVDKETDEFQLAVKAGKIKPMINAGWSMQVPKEADTFVDIRPTEADIIQCVVQEMCRGDRKHLTRLEAVTRLIARHVLPHHAHASDVQEFEIGQDDGPDLELFKEIIGEHVACYNIDARDVDGLIAAYTKPATIADHHDHLHAHFEVKPEKLASFRSKRVARETEHREKLAKHHAEHAALAAAKHAAKAAKKDKVRP